MEATTRTDTEVHQITEYTSTRNACKLCAPLGACLVFRGIEGSVPVLHGSQGCATYIRRYLISHFREPVDAASSSFSEETAVFGGERNLHKALDNVTARYSPGLIGVASTCLSETIGDDLPMIIQRYRERATEDPLPDIVTVSTPSYSGTHMEGFHAATRAVAAAFGGEERSGERALNLFPGLLSPADLRHLKEILQDFGLSFNLLPDYSETLDGPVLCDYQPIPSGGTPLSALRRLGRAAASLSFGLTLHDRYSPGALLAERNGVEDIRLPMPIGLEACDAFFAELSLYAGRDIPEKYRKQRGRLIDSYVDGHKYLFGKRAVVYGEEDLVAGLAGFLSEIGVLPVVCASGGRSGKLKEALAVRMGEGMEDVNVVEGIDYAGIEALARSVEPDLLVGNSYGYVMSPRLGVPLVRVGFPIHDRIGGQRILHVGYAGTQRIYDRVTNALIRRQQEDNPVGYLHM